MRPERPNLRPGRKDLKFERCDSRPERLELRHPRCDMRFEMFDLRRKTSYEEAGRWMNKPMNR